MNNFWKDTVENITDVEFTVHKHNTKLKLDIANFLSNHSGAIALSIYAVVCAVFGIGAVIL